MTINSCLHRAEPGYILLQRFNESQWEKRVYFADRIIKKGVLSQGAAALALLIAPSHANCDRIIWQKCMLPTDWD